jgi:hypothetical protein
LMEEVMQVDHRVRIGLAKWISVVLLIFFSTAALLPMSASARVKVCRKDPVVSLSNGDVVQMTATIETDAANVRHVTYTLRVPQGTTMLRIAYTGGSLRARDETVVLVDDLPQRGKGPRHYQIVTSVEFQRGEASFTATTRVASVVASARGNGLTPAIVSIVTK